MSAGPPCFDCTGSPLRMLPHDDSPFLRLLLAGQQQLRRFIGRSVRNGADADDIYQETLMRMLERSRQGAIAQPVPYAMQVARNLIIDRAAPPVLPIETVAEVLPCPAPLADQRLDEQERLRLFREVLAAMPPLRREVFVRRRLHGQSRERIARDLGLEVNAVKKHISRALAQLTRAMGACGGDLTE